jgi:hypothetical protein
MPEEKEHESVATPTSNDQLSLQSHLPHHLGAILVLFALSVFGLGVWIGHTLSGTDDSAPAYQAGYDAAMQEARAKLVAQGLIMEPVPGQVPSTDLTGIITTRTGNILTLTLPSRDPLADPQEVTVTLSADTEIRELIDDINNPGTLSPDGEWLPPEPTINRLTVEALEESMWVTIVLMEATADAPQKVAESVTFYTTVFPEPTPDPLEPLPEVEGTF